MPSIFRKLSAIAILTVLAVAQPLMAQPWLAPGGVSPVEVELISEQSSVTGGQPFWLGLKLNIEDEWHIYWKNPGDAGVPPTVNWELPEGFTAGPLLWPSPERFSSNDFTGYGYHHHVMLLVQVTPPKDLKPGQELKLAGEVQWVACAESCVPGMKAVEITVNSADQAVTAEKSVLASLQKAKDRLPRSIWAVRACQQNNLIELEISSTPNQSLITASFIPNDAGVINDNAEQTLEFNEKEPGRYVLRLQRPSEGASESSALQGLLVLTEPLMHDESHQVLSLNLPLSDQCSSSNLVAAVKPTTVKSEPKPPSTSKSEATLTDAPPSLSFSWALILAFGGGLLLNLMPCVLPVISLKLFHFISMSKESRGEIFAHGLAFCAGVLVSFWTLVSILLALKAYGSGAGWGFQLQDPRFVAFMIVLLFVFALSLWGVFELGMSLASKAGSLEGKSKGKMGTFFSGVLATVVATPCTGPGLGPVLGFAVTLPAIYSLMIFTAMGLGMSMPYLICSAFPQLIRFLPKPGAWMETFKQMMGFFMAATVVWLLWVFGSQTGNNALFMLVISLFCFVIACWIYGQWGHSVRRGLARNAIYAMVMVFASLGVFLAHKAANTAPMPIEGDSRALANQTTWEPYSEERLQQYLSEGRPVFIDFTAKWCITCQASKVSLGTDDVNQQFDKHNVVRMRADWTQGNPEITQKLSELGRASVPVHALYDGKNGRPKIMSSVPLRESEVLKALDRLESVD